MKKLGTALFVAAIALAGAAAGRMLAATPVASAQEGASKRKLPRPQTVAVRYDSTPAGDVTLGQVTSYDVEELGGKKFLVLTVEEKGGTRVYLNLDKVLMVATGPTSADRVEPARPK